MFPPVKRNEMTEVGKGYQPGYKSSPVQVTRKRVGQDQQHLLGGFLAPCSRSASKDASDTAAARARNEL